MVAERAPVAAKHTLGAGGGAPLLSCRLAVDVPRSIFLASRTSIAGSSGRWVGRHNAWGCLPHTTSRFRERASSTRAGGSGNRASFSQSYLLLVV